MEVTFSHPRVGVVSDWANSPVDFCSEQPAAAGPAGTHEVGGGHWNTLLPFYNYLMNSTDFSISGCI